MIVIAPRENTALLPGRLLLVPTGRSFLSAFAPAAPRGPAYANTLKMILLRNDKLKLPGIILLHKTAVRLGPSSHANDVSRGNPFRTCTLEENRSRKGRASKSFKMIFLCDSKNNLPGMISLRKKVGGTPVGALSMPNRPSGRSSAKKATNRMRFSREAKSSGRSGEDCHPERSEGSLLLRQRRQAREHASNRSGYNLPSQLEGTPYMTKDSRVHPVEHS